MRTEYIILLHDNERAWLDATPSQRAETFARHDEFTRRCGEDGHKITGGAELQPSGTARIVRGGNVGITDGPTPRRQSSWAVFTWWKLTTSNPLRTWSVNCWPTPPGPPKSGPPSHPVRAAR